MGIFFEAIYTQAASHTYRRLLDPSKPVDAPPRRKGVAAIIVQLTGFEENGMRKADPYLP
jgi:hypothetical protein